MAHMVINGVLATAAAILSTIVFLQENFNSSNRSVPHSPKAAEEILQRHSEKFDRPLVQKVTEGVYVAIGYGLSNIIMIEGANGIVIVDTSESAEIALRVMHDFRNVTAKPLVGVILTNHHTDHILGAQALIDQTDAPVRVYMHSTTAAEFDRSLNVRPVMQKRTRRQYGAELKTRRDIINAGIGPRFSTQKSDLEHHLVEATHTFSENASFNLEGVSFELFHTPGAARDQVTVWLPQRGVVMPGDNIYECFPNLYPIAGSPARDAVRWYRSLDLVRDLYAEHMVPSHTRPVAGQKRVYDVVTDYRDAIQHVHDQTVRLMNRNVPTDEIAERVRLPRALAAHPFLQECAGRVAWSVRAVQNGYVGWFDGDPVRMRALSEGERAQRLAELLVAAFDVPDPSELTGAEKMIMQAEHSYRASALNLKRKSFHLIGDVQWALELASMARKASARDSAAAHHAKVIMITCMRALARSSAHASERNYYLTCAYELESGGELAPSREAIKANQKTAPIDRLMAAMPARFRAETCDGAERTKLMVDLVDLDRQFFFTVRNCVVELQAEPPKVAWKFDVTLSLRSALWRDLLSGDAGILDAFQSNNLQIQGSMSSFRRFMEAFDPPSW